MAPPITSPEIRFWRRVTKRGPDDCWLWTGGHSGNGYGKFRTGGARSKQTVAHRFSYEMHFGPVPDGMLVLHKCDVRSCVNPCHLFIGTQIDNMADCWGKGRQGGEFKPGFDHRRKFSAGVRKGRKLTEKSVLAIRADNRNNRIIAADYGINPATVREVKKKESWKNV